MLFPSRELAARIERAESHLILSATSAVLDRPGSRGFVTALAGGVAAFASAGSPLNKVAGLGFGDGLDDASLTEVEHRFAELGASTQAEVSSLADPDVFARLMARGYRLEAFENVLGCPLSPAQTVDASDDSGITIVRDPDFDTWLGVMLDGFAAPDSERVAAHDTFPRDVMDQVMRDMAGASGFSRYLALWNGQPAGGGSLRIDGTTAQLCGATTLPAFRRRGIQAALLTHRLSDVAQAGCDVAVVTTQPGSISHANAQRKGFELLYVRAILIRPAPVEA